MTRRNYALLAPLAILLAGCAEEPKQAVKKEPPKPPEPVTGRFAFHQMYAMARTWSPDIKALRLESINLPDVKSGGGKAGAWRAMFVSESRGRARGYTYSVIEAEGNLHKGVFAGLEETYSGPRGQAKPFLIQALKVDSDAAWETAAKKSAEYMKKNPDKPVLFLLELTRFPDPAWRVVWGESVGTSNYSIFVDATTGEYLLTGR